MTYFLVSGMGSRNERRSFQVIILRAYCQLDRPSQYEKLHECQTTGDDNSSTTGEYCMLWHQSTTYQSELGLGGLAYNMGSSNQGSHCSVVGLLGLLIQLLLGLLSFSVLIIKRQYESPRREWKIWRLDTLKQVISQLLAHFTNLVISMALTLQQPNSDTCLWYFTTNVLDNTVGVFLCVMALRLVERQLIRKGKLHLVSGNYYSSVEEHEPQVNPREGQEVMILPPQKIKVDYRAWGVQLAIWNLIVILSKGMLFVMEYFLRGFLINLSNNLLWWIEAYPRLEVVFVLVVVPVIMNALAFWVQDNFLKKAETTIRQTAAEPNAQQANNGDQQMQEASGDARDANTTYIMKQQRDEQAHDSPPDGQDLSAGL